MTKSSNLKEIIEKISVEKELLSTMPKNNAKNIKKYKEKIEELFKEYTKNKEEILEALENKYEKETNIEENPEISNLTTRINTIEKVLYLFNDDKSSYEKIGLDKNIYKIGKFYKDNFENINIQILESINKFKEVGIDLSISDFEYTTYVKQYMQVFFNELPNINSDKLKSKFEELYWKCPDIIIHIEMNIRNIYFKYENKIDKYIEKEKNDLLKKWDKEPKDIMGAYLELKEKKDNLMKINKKIIMEKLMIGKMKTKDYEENKIIKSLKEIYQNDKLENEEELEENVYKFLNSLYEYENYSEFKFIINDIKKYYEEKENYKKVYDETKKKIDLIEKKILNINKKIIKPGFFGRKKDNSHKLVEQNQLILELDGLYKELDLDNCYTKISNKLKDNSTIYDALKIAESSYYYLITLIIKNQKDIEQDEIEEKIERLEEFIKSPYNNIINNLTILEDKDVALIIKDRYKLSYFILEKEDLDIDNVESLISTLNKIEEYFNMRKIKINMEEINELLEIKKILNK